MNICVINLLLEQKITVVFQRERQHYIFHGAQPCCINGPSPLPSQPFRSVLYIALTAPNGSEGKRFFTQQGCMPLQT